MKASLEVKATEDEDSVKLCLSNFFPDLEIVRSDNRLVVEGDDSGLKLLKEKIWAKKILGTVRNRLIKNTNDEKTFLLLNKQAAFAGRLSVVDEEKESALGTLKVEFAVNLIDWISPKTRNGVPIC